MPHYFFDVHDGVEVIDEVGWELSGLEAARVEALRIASEFSTRERMIGKDGGAIVVTVRQPADEIVLSVRLVFNIEARSLRLVARD